MMVLAQSRLKTDKDNTNLYILEVQRRVSDQGKILGFEIPSFTTALAAAGTGMLGLSTFRTYQLASAGLYELVSPDHNWIAYILSLLQKLSSQGKTVNENTIVEWTNNKVKRINNHFLKIQN
jgi:hypothetical protein